MSDKKEIVRHSAAAVLRLSVLALRGFHCLVVCKGLHNLLLTTGRESPHKGIDRA